MTLIIPYWRQKEWFLDHLALSLKPPILLPESRFTQTAPSPLLSPELPLASANCLENQQWITRHLGFSRAVVCQLPVARQLISQKLYQYS